MAGATDLRPQSGGCRPAAALGHGHAHNQLPLTRSEALVLVLAPDAGGSVALMMYMPGPPPVPPAVGGAVITPLPAPLPPRHSNLPLVPVAMRSIDSDECDASVRVPGLSSLTTNRYVLPCSPCSCRL
jgi:hypothetical protein